MNKKSLKYSVPRIKTVLVAEGVRSSDLHPCRTPEEAASFLKPLMLSAEERFVALHLNIKHEVIGVHEVSHGTVSLSLVHPREVFKAAILNNAYALVIAHNHPSCSDLHPSREDIDMTKQLLGAAEILGISIVDHIIVSPTNTFYSIRENHPILWSD